LKFSNTELIYWISTSIVTLFLVWSAYSYSFNQAAIKGFKELGFPDFFRFELIILKIIAAFCLVMPFIPFSIKQWAYAGVGLFLLTAIIAHIAHKDSIAITFINILLICLLAISNYYLKVQ